MLQTRAANNNLAYVLNEWIAKSIRAVSENSENCPSHFPEAQFDAFK